jgi:hypothetical protein
MNRSTPDFEPRVADWLEDDPHEAPREVLATVLAAIPSIRQARRGPFAPWRFSRMTTYTRLAAAAIVAVIAIGGAVYLLNPPGGIPPGGPGPTATPNPTATPAPTQSVVQAGTITLTDDACAWEGNPSPITTTGGQVLVRFSARNETDTFGNFSVYRVDSGTWEEAAAWIERENAALHGGPTQSFADFVTAVGNLDAPERREYPSGLFLDPGMYGIVCTTNEPPPGKVFSIFVVGPFEIAAQ